MTVTQSDIDAYRDEVRAKYADKPFRIDSNGYGVRVECELCHESATRNLVFPFLEEHLRHCEKTDRDR